MTDEMVRADTGVQIRRYAILAYGAFGVMLGLGLMVVGTLLVGLAISVLLAGFDLVDVIQDLSTGGMLGSALVLAVIGLFCLGVAAEGPLGRGRDLVGFKLWELGVGQILASLAVGLIMVLAHGLIADSLEGLPVPVITGADGIRAAGIAGLTVVPLIGIPLALLARWYPEGPDWLPTVDVPIVFVVWAVATMGFMN